MSIVIAEFKELELEEIQHEHPLNFKDLQLIYQDYKEDDDDFDDNELITLQQFKCLCDRCGKDIDWYHRYYYQCSQSSCNYSLHKFCAELPITLQYPSHPAHILVIGKKYTECQRCTEICRNGICYHCYDCNYQIDLPCATLVDQNTIHHPGHPHPLVSVNDDDILCWCFACSKKHEGVFYHCIMCLNFSIHVDCVSLPIKSSLRDNRFSHPHLLTLSYSIVGIPEDCKCPICGIDFIKHSWIYKCSKCLFYIHLDCATSRREPFMSIFLTGGLHNPRKNFLAVDYPHLIQFPLLDETYNIIPLMIKADASRDIKQTIDENGYLIHFIHEHPLILIQDEKNEDTTAPSSSRTKLIQFHNPMKRIRLLCNGCSRPITSLPYYKCSKEDECSKFVLHEWCTQLSPKLESYPDHSEHTLHLMSNVPNKVCGVFECSLCGFFCNGFAYSCLECEYYIDVNCAYIPENIAHEAHPNHLLSREYVPLKGPSIKCSACLAYIYRSDIRFGYISRRGFHFKCSDCDFYLHHQCALYLLKTIRHKHDKHSLRLSYSPIQNHKSDYFCEICEDKLNPYKWFYHCLECAQSMHSFCAPLILNFEQVNDESPYDIGIYRFINLKFGGVFETEDHSHPLSLVPGTGNLGYCRKCTYSLDYTLVLKCLQCEFALHYNCRLVVDDRVMRFTSDYLKFLLDRKRRFEMKEIVGRRLIRPTMVQQEVINNVHQ